MSVEDAATRVALGALALSVSAWAVVEVRLRYWRRRLARTIAEIAAKAAAEIDAEWEEANR